MLNTQPTADVTIALSSSDTTEGTVVAGEPDLHDRELERAADGDGDRRRRSSLDDGDDRLHDRDGAGGEHATPNYNGVNAADVAVTNTDNDAAGITVTPTAGPDDDRSRRDGDLHGRAEHAADGGRDDRR